MEAVKHQVDVWPHRFPDSAAAGNVLLYIGFSDYIVILPAVIRPGVELYRLVAFRNALLGKGRIIFGRT